MFFKILTGNVKSQGVTFQESVQSSVCSLCIFIHAKILLFGVFSQIFYKLWSVY